MFDAIKEWLSGLLGGATEHVENAQQSLQDLNPAEHLGDAASNLGEQAQNVQNQVDEHVNSVKNNLPK